MFQDVYSFEIRKNESERIMIKHKDRIPCIVQKAPHSKLMAHKKIKYLVASTSPMSDIIYFLRKSVKLETHQSLFFMINDTLVATSSIMGQIYQDMKSKDGFLYIYYSEESTFG